MQENIVFTKIIATGNSFIVIDNRENILTDNINKVTKNLCSYANGIGADGVLALEESDIADFKMRIINSDGSEAEMCGNGARAVAYYAFTNGIAEKKMSFDTIAGKIEAEVKDNVVKVKMLEPQDFKEDEKLNIEKQNIVFSSVNTGVPHAVMFVDSIENADVFSIGRSIREHDYFKPAGTNVNFVQVIDKNDIKVRTYERGVENETLACGTGSTASAIVSALKGFVKSPVSVETRSKEILKIYFDINENKEINNIYMEGKVKEIFKGTIRVHMSS